MMCSTNLLSSDESTDDESNKQKSCVSVKVIFLDPIISNP